MADPIPRYMTPEADRTLVTQAARNLFPGLRPIELLRDETLHQPLLDEMTRLKGGAATGPTPDAPAVNTEQGSGTPAGATPLALPARGGGLAALEAAVRAAPEPAAPSAPAAATPAPAGPSWTARVEDFGGRVGKSVARSVTDLPGRVWEDAKTVAGAPKRTLDLMLGSKKPEGLTDAALLGLGGMGAMALTGGGAAALAPAHPALVPLTQVATAFALSKLRGSDNWEAALDTVGAGMGATATGAATKFLGRPARGIDAVRDLIKRDPLDLQRFNQYLDWIQKGWRSTGPKVAKNASAAMARAEDAAKWLAQVDPTGQAAKIFREQVMRGAGLPGAANVVHLPALGGVRTAVGKLPRAAQRLRESPVGRAGITALTGTPPQSTGLAVALPWLVSQVGPKGAAHAVMPTAE
jgi:hypothetical protein